MNAYPSFRTRSTRTEWMDTEPTTQQDYAACLADLAAVNTITLARLPTLAFIRRAARLAAARHPGPHPLRVLDVGCGEGDMLRRLHRWAARTNYPLHLTGLDLSHQGNAAAHAATPAHMNIAYRTADVFAPGLGEYDVIISSLFTHHLTNPQLVAFLRTMEAHTTIGWFVNDLHRHPVAYHGFRALAALAGWHRFVRHDGPISVARSFQRHNWERLLAQAGLEHQAHIRWHLPFRYCVQRFK